MWRQLANLNTIIVSGKCGVITNIDNTKGRDAISKKYKTLKPIKYEHF